MTDSDENRWQEVKQREWKKVPQDCQHLAVFGVADRNIECWLALDRQALADEIHCDANDLAVDDPKGVIESGFEYGRRDIEEVKRRIRDFVCNGPIKNWIRAGDSFEDFYGDVRALAARTGCNVPNERDAAD